MMPAQFKYQMFKKFLLFGVLLMSVIVTTYVLAQEDNSQESTTAATISPVDNEKIKALKEKLATKVAELRENQTRGFYGEIASLNKTSFTLATTSGEIKVRISEDTLVFKFVKGKKTPAKITDLKNNLSASVLGIYESDLNQLTAKIIFLETLPKFLSGKVAEIDKNKAVITITRKNGDKTSLDYEKSTLSFEYKASDESIAKSGLSRLSESDLLYVWGLPSEDDIQKFQLIRLLRIPKSVVEKEGEVSKTSPPPQAEKDSAATPTATPKSKSTASPSPKSTP